MAAVLLSSPPLPSTLPPPFLKKQSKIVWKQKKCGKFRVCSKEPSSQFGVSRRDLTFIVLSSSLSLIFPLSGFGAEEEFKMGSSVDDINAYSYLYPIEMPSKKFVFKCVTSTQQLAESSLLDAHASEIDGEPYWYYEYLVRKSPTKTSQESNLFRHYVASTAERDGYLYTLSASTLGKQWEKMGPSLEKTVASFRLLPPTESYVPPYKDPWRFW